MPENLSQLEIPTQPVWTGLVDRVRAAEPAAMEELYAIFSKGVRFYLWRQLGTQDLDDRLHDIFLIITQSIQRGELRDPERLMGYVRTVARRQVAGQIETTVKSRRYEIPIEPALNISDRTLNPERRAIESQNNEIATRILKSLPHRDREVLSRFYLDEQGPDQICADLHLTQTQFRLVKSRAKARFGELGRRRFAPQSSSVH